MTEEKFREIYRQHYQIVEKVVDVYKRQVQICAADGFRIASDKNGAAVKQQIVRYMKENLGNAGIEALLKKTEEEKKELEEQENIKNGGMEELNSEETIPMPEISETNNPCLLYTSRCV